MTQTATKPRKKTKKTAKATTRKVQKKKPKWALVTYKQIETRRDELGLSKSAMAVMLGVTNSTYHNWRRKTTVPHEGQQEKILQAMHSGPSMVDRPTSSKKKASSKKVTSKAKATSKVRPPRSERTALADLPLDSDASLGDDPAIDSTPRAVDATVEDSDAVSGQSQTRAVASKVQIIDTLNRRAAVASVVNTFISESKGKATANTVIQLTEGLSRAFA